MKKVKNFIATVRMFWMMFTFMLKFYVGIKRQELKQGWHNWRNAGTPDPNAPLTCRTRWTVEDGQTVYYIRLGNEDKERGPFSSLKTARDAAAFYADGPVVAV